MGQHYRSRLQSERIANIFIEYFFKIKKIFYIHLHGNYFHENKTWGWWHGYWANGQVLAIFVLCIGMPERGAAQNTNDWMTPNRQEVLKALNTMQPSSSAMKRSIDAVRQTGQLGLLDYMSGEVHAKVRDSLYMASDVIGDVGLQQMREGLEIQRGCGANAASSQGRVACGSPQKKSPLWMSAQAGIKNMEGDGNASSMKAKTYGLVIGGSQAIGSQGWYIGAAWGYVHTNNKVDQRLSIIRVQNYSAAVFLGKTWALGQQRLHVIGGGSYTWHTMKTGRYIPMFNNISQAEYQGDTKQVFAEAAYAVDLAERSALEPFARITVTRQSVENFKDRGGRLGVHAVAVDATRTSSLLGIRAQHPFWMGNRPLQVQVRVAWQHTWTGRELSRTMAFNEGGQWFRVAGVAQPANLALLGVQAEMPLTRALSFQVAYQGEFGARLRQHAAALRMQWVF